MKQPTRKTGTTVKKKTTAPKKKKTNTTVRRIKTPKTVKYSTKKYTKGHPQYGISKAEQEFGHNFLDAYGIQYIYQYFATEIGRYYDFAVVERKKNYITEVKDGMVSVKQEGQIAKPILLIEFDGDYFHPNEEMIKEGKLTPTQKHNIMVDHMKDRWAGLNCIPLLRIRQSDVMQRPDWVKQRIEMYLGEIEKKLEIKEKRRKGH